MECLEICVIAPPGEANIAVMVRCGPNTVVDSVPAAAVTALSAFPAQLGRAILGTEERPSAAAIHKYGRDLFDTLAREKTQAIFHGLPPGPLSFTLLSNRPDFQ